MSPKRTVDMPPGMVCVFSSVFAILCCCVVTQSSASSSHHPTFLRNDTYFEHLALHPDPELGRVYLGARDQLYQLSSDLQLEAEEKTGPVIDSRDCLPPISEANCPQAQWTNNHNKLLLVDPYSQELISCGSVYQGICQKRSLDAVGKVLFSAERPVDTQYVAANDPNVSTVGLVALTKGRGKQQPVLFVGRGYTNSQPPISTRNLVMDPVFSYEETSKLAVAGRLSEYDHHFVTSFTHRSYVYFMFYRRDLQSPSREYRTYVSRMCLDDAAYYSYVEVPLSCRSAGGKNYNLLQALHVGLPKLGKAVGIESATALEQEVLLGVFSSHFASSSRPNEESAVCVFSLEEVDKHINATRDLCYTEMGRADGKEVAYIEYEVKSNCANLPENTLDAYPCGSDHTPSPMASRVLVKAEPIFDSPSVRLTAVAVSVREEHTIAFLGDSQGNLHKVFLGPNGEVEEYAVISIHPSAPISRELRLDHQEKHLYILTSNMLEKRPVAECEKHFDCQSCLLAHDPYCGWCVLEGKCGLRSECMRGDQKDQWLWSFDIEQQCLSVTDLNPSNISREERRNISLSIPGLPSLERGEHYSCVFQERSSLAVVTETGVTCSSPHVYTLPSVPLGQDFFTVTLSLRFHDVVVTSQDFTFYDCTAVKQLAGSMPCHGCVQSRWGCNWCVNQHMCTHKAVCDEGLIIYNEHWKSLPTLPATKAPRAAFMTSPVTTHKVPETMAHTKPPTTATAITETITSVLESLTTPAPVKATPSTEMSSTFKPSAAPTSPFLPSSTAETTVQPASTLSLLDEILSEKELLVTDIESVALRETDTDVVTLASLEVVVKTELPSVIKAAEEQKISLTSSSAETELPPLMEPVAQDVSPTTTPHSLAETLNLINETQTTVLPSNPELNMSVSENNDFLPMPERVSSAMPSENRIITDSEVAHLAPEETEEVDQVENDNATFSAATVLSGDGESDSDPTVYLHFRSTDTDADYQYDSDLQADEGTFVNWGASACPCVEKIQGSSLLPALTQRKISLLARNLHLYQDKELAYECVLVIEGQTVVVDADVMLNEANPSLFDITCHGHQYSYAEPVREYNAMVYVKRKDTFHIDSTDLYGGAFVRYEEDCEVKTASLLLCRTPGVDAQVVGGDLLVEFLLDNLSFDFNSVSQSPFTYEPNPTLHPLNHRDPTKPYRYKPGSVISVEVQMGYLNFSLGQVQYDSPSHSIFPLVAQIGVGAVASLVALIVLIIVFIYRRKSKQALRDYKKVQIQLENLETSVRDRCKKEFTDLMTEMMDMTSDLVGSGIPFLEYRMYAERIFFPGHRESPLRRDLDVQECRRATVEQGLIQLSNLLNSKLFLTKFIHTLESQRTFSPRDRGYVASLLTVALHSKLEYFTDILKTLLNDLVEQYIAKNPKLMLRRTETVVEKLLTNWISICLYAFLRHSAGESLYMLFRAIKHQVDKGPVDAVTGKAKYTLNDNRLLREDLEYHTLTVNVLMQGIGVNEAQPVAAKVLDCDTITQVKEKILDQVYKGTSYSHRPHADSVDLEWRSGVAGHLILSDEDLTSVVQGNWKRLNTLQHYKVPDGATVALVPRHSKHIHHDTHDYIAGEKTPMLEDADEGGVRLWHLVKASEEPELPKHRRGSLKERERAKTIPEIYLTRLLSMKGTLQKFVDDLFTVILSTSQPVPLAIKYFFDLLDDQAVRHGISDSETIHIWKTNSLPLRFWINIVKNPQFIFDVQVSDNVDAVLSVIAQTFMDSCTTAEHKLGRDSPINKLLYARDIPRYKHMVERYYADIKQTISASDQEMNSALAELSRNYSGELNYLVALHELYKYINKYYDQIITALEEDTTAQKMQLGYRLQQIAAAVENKVTDL
ncbi:plexin-B1-like isoform X1 [Labeo rohita]|uniref:Plexin-B1 n=1 Tax=Labeo rohita TaxID=84645 RepID=A0A498MZI6_LABRO|nr:plexin-B1-like isoform X1 [Labeo rohita]